MRPVRDIVLPLALLTACGFGSLSLSNLVPAHADRYAREYIGLVARGEVDSAELKLAANLPHDSARVFLRSAHDKLAGAILDSAELVGAQVTASMMGDGSTVTTRRIGYLVPAGGKWLLFVLSMKEEGGFRQLTGLHYDLFDVDPRVASRFTFTGKGPAHVLFLGLGLLCMAGALGSAVWVFRQKGLPKRPLWTFVALIGVGSASLNWGSGGFGQRGFDLLLFCFGVVKGGPIEPWIVSLAFPAGAFVAVARVRAWKTKQAAFVAEAPPASVPAEVPPPESSGL